MVIWNPWLVGSLILLGMWFLIFIVKKRLRKEMFWVGLATIPLGLTEPLFVPEYWSPPSMFDLASKTGFDIESLIFAFAVGGIVAVLYEFFIKVRHKKIKEKKGFVKRHKFGVIGLISPLIVFMSFYFLSDINSIYSVSLAFFVGAIIVLICRPDLKGKVLLGGVLFAVLYFVSFLVFNMIYPDFIQNVWNFSTISGILVIGVPIEEIMFAFTFGMFWSSIYEHFMWYKLKRVE
jgi:hypothetical protein